MAPWENIYAVEDDDLDKKAIIWENIFNSVINKHAPFITYKEKHPNAAWLNDDIRKLMTARDCKKFELNDISKALLNTPETSPNYNNIKSQAK